MKTSDFDFYLPEELIAQTPVEPRDSSRLLVLDRETGEITMADFNTIKQTVSPKADGTLPDADNKVMLLFRRRYGAIREAIVIK